MATGNETTTGTMRHCGYCGQGVPDGAPAIERFGERFCSERHAEEFVAGVRAARIEAAARVQSPEAGGALPPRAQRTWKDHLKQGACWGAPLLIILAIPLFWSGSAAAATGGSVLSVLALLACPLGMFFMMRAMSNMGHGGQPPLNERADVRDERALRERSEAP